MPFREKAKALLKSRPRSPHPNPNLPKDSVPSAESHTFYGDNEPIPGPKYRKPPAKEHTEKLEAFSFADAWRKKSFQSARSPMGTRASSRRNSLWSRKSSVVSAKAGASRRGSVAAEQTEDVGGGAELAREETVKPVAVGEDTQLEQSTTVRNVAPQQKKQRDANGAASDHQPFSEEDFAHALQRSHLHEVEAQS